MPADNTTSPCKTLLDMCGAAGCTTMVLTKGFDATKKAGKVFMCKAAQHSLLSGDNSTTNNGGGGGGGGASSFDAAACRAKPLTDYANGWVNAGAWGSLGPILRLNGLTCNDICERRGQTCDPCAISKLNCQDAYKYVADRVGMPLATPGQESVLGGVDTGDLGRAILYPAPGCSATACAGPWPQSVCATATQPNSIVSTATYNMNDYPGITTKSWIADPTSSDIEEDAFVVNYAIQFLYNWYNPGVPFYRDPAQACNQVVASRRQTEPSIVFIYGGAFCYCV
jgi:hypothetical protein